MKRKIVLSAVLAVILISTAFVGLALHWSRVSVPPPTTEATFGPKIEVSVSSVNNIASSANVTESLQILGADPSYLFSAGTQVKTGQDIPSSGYMTLFNQTYELSSASAPSGIQFGFLNNNFSKILSSWQSAYRDEHITHQTFSLSIESTLSIRNNGTLNVYAYFNNLPYTPSSLDYTGFLSSSNSTLNNWFNGTGINPSSYSSISYVPVAFNATPSFDLSNPTYSTTINSTTSGSGASAPSVYSPSGLPLPPQPTGTIYKELWSENWPGPEPLLSVHIDQSYPASNQFLGIMEGISTSTVEMSINSDQTGVNSNGSVTDQMSSEPSWSGTGVFSADGSGAQWVAFPNSSPVGGTTENINDTTAMIWLENCVYSITHYDIFYCYYQDSQYHRDYLGNATSVSIADVSESSGGHYQLGYGYESIYLYDFMKVLNNGGPETNLGALKAGGDIQSGQIWEKTKGYTKAAREEQTIVNATVTFNAALGVGLADIALEAAISGETFDAAEPAIILAALGLVSSMIGLIAREVLDFSTISFSTTFFDYGFYLITSGPNTNASSYAYSLADYESPNQVTLSHGGNNYEFTGPTNFIVAS